jgi:hypothetical protein
MTTAYDRDADTLAPRRQVLGLDHPDTLRSANNLAAELRELGDLQAARELDEDLALREDFRSLLAQAPSRSVIQNTRAGRDAFVAGRDINIHGPVSDYADRGISFPYPASSGDEQE